MSPLVDVTKIFPQVYPFSTPAFSYPHLSRFSQPDYRGDMTRLSLIPWTSESRQILTGISEDPLPQVCRPSTAPPIPMSPLEWDTIPRTKMTPRNAFMLVNQVLFSYSNLLEDGPNPFIDENSREVFGTIYSKLEPSWMRPGTSRDKSYSNQVPGKPYQGLWIGEYSAHGDELLLFLQRSPTMLEVIKISGDPNVP